MGSTPVRRDRCLGFPVRGPGWSVGPAVLGARRLAGRCKLPSNPGATEVALDASGLLHSEALGILHSAGNRPLPLLRVDVPHARLQSPSDRDSPVESSQYSTCRPTKLDDRQNRLRDVAGAPASARMTGSILLRWSLPTGRLTPLRSIATSQRVTIPVYARCGLGSLRQRSSECNPLRRTAWLTRYLPVRHVSQAEDA